MYIVNFEKQHIPAARAIALANFEEERQAVPPLPPLGETPDLTRCAENGLGVAAMENEQMVGFLCCCDPWEKAFGSAARGTFSPIHAHGAVPKNRTQLYRRMYQAAAEKWVAQGILYHAIALYAHDRQALDAFFRYGFGVRCVDAIRSMDSIDCKPLPGITFRELGRDEVFKIRQMRRSLSDHLGASPCFLNSSRQAFEAWLAGAEKRNTRIFAAEKENAPIAYIEVGGDGENFLSESPDMKNICGAFCKAEYRGTGVFTNLLNDTIRLLEADGAVRLGVDYESFNPTASGAWEKYFTPYTNSVVRRIDECALVRTEQETNRCDTD